MSVKEFLKDLAKPLIIALLTLIFGVLGSQLSTDNWMTWIQLVPLSIWLLFVILMFIWITSILVKRYKRLHVPTVLAGVGNYCGRIENIGCIKYKGVSWRIYANKTSHFDPLDNVTIKNIESEDTPRCPSNTCGNELEQNKSFWGGYVWSCPRCGFKMRNKDSFATESRRASSIARSKFENNRTV